MSILYKNRSLSVYWMMFNENGWVDCERDLGDDTHEFQLRVLAMNWHDVRAVWLKSLDVCGDIGVGWIDIKPDDNGDHEFLDEAEENDIRLARKLAEENLLRLGIPFVEDYKFVDDRGKRKARINKAIRKRLDVDGYIEKLQAIDEEKWEKRQSEKKEGSKNEAECGQESR